MNEIENKSKKELKELIKTVVSKHESSKVLDPDYDDNDLEFRDCCSKFESTMSVETVDADRHEMGLLITESRKGLYGLYTTYKYHGRSNVSFQPVFKSRDIKELYNDAVVSDLHKYFRRQV